MSADQPQGTRPDVVTVGGQLEISHLNRDRIRLVIQCSDDHEATRVYEKLTADAKAGRVTVTISTRGLADAQS